MDILFFFFFDHSKFDLDVHSIESNKSDDEMQYIKICSKSNKFRTQRISISWKSVSSSLEKKETIECQIKAKKKKLSVII